MKNVLITPDGIQKNLKSFRPLDALCEYIWNGFDAEATEVCVDLHENELGLVNMITVRDNGTGIPYEELETKFQRFNDSTRIVSGDKITRSLPRGKGGSVGSHFLLLHKVADGRQYMKKTEKDTHII